MGDLLKKAWGAVGFWGQLVSVLAVLAAVGGGLYWVYDKIETSGYNRAMKEVADAAAQREKEASEQISKAGIKYEKIKQKIRSEPGYLAPVSPLVGDAIMRVPEPQAGGK